MTDSPRYHSTRGGSLPVTFEQALWRGLAPDGGLYVPDRVPRIPETDWQAPRLFAELGGRVLRRWLASEIDPGALQAVAADALDVLVPVVPLAGDGWDGVYVVELFHGPTLSFKDVGARTMARLMGRFQGREVTPRTVLVATSGDTGSAVADGFAGQPGLRVVLLYPHGRVSPTQELQLVVKRPNVTTCAVEGTFDDCQRLVKEAFGADDLAPFHLTSANSINVGRLLPQMLYYFWAVRKAEVEGPVVFCVPSGNLGNLTAGVLAMQSGLPVARFLAAHNANDGFPRFLAGGDVRLSPSVPTLSNAMDVGLPSNLERLRALASDDDLRRCVWGTSVTDDDTLESMRRVHAETGYTADPHTAVGLEAARRYRAEAGSSRPVFVLATAHPAKFPETVERALGQPVDEPRALSVLRRRPTAAHRIAPTLAALREVLEAHVAP